MSLIGTWYGKIQGVDTTLGIYANQTFKFRDMVGKWEERGGKLMLVSDQKTSIYNYATNYLIGKETLTLIYEGDRIDDAVILTKETPNDPTPNQNNAQYSQNFVNFLQQMSTLGSYPATPAPLGNTSGNIFLPSSNLFSSPPLSTPVNNYPLVNNGVNSVPNQPQSYTKARWGITFAVPDGWFVVEKKALNSIMVASSTEPGLIMIRFMPGMNILFKSNHHYPLKKQLFDNGTCRHVPANVYCWI